MGRRSFYSAVLLWVLFCFLVSAGISSADVVTPPGGGAGSYSTSVPGQGTKPDGVTVVKAVPPAVGPNVLPAETRKVPTSDWWTPLVWVDPSDLPDPSPKAAMNALSWQVFSEPFVFQPQKGGLAAALNIPDSRRAAGKNGTITAGEGFMPAPVDAPEKEKADRMAGYIRQAYESRNPHFMNQGSYFGAQEMHRLAMLLPVAGMVKSTASDPAAVEKAAEDMYTYLAEQMGIWLRASRDGGTTPKNAAERLFYYDSRWGSLIPTPEDGFAADSLLNDHHFHYGYFLKIATELARWEKTHPVHSANKKWAEAYAPMIRLLIKDIANIEREGTKILAAQRAV